MLLCSYISIYSLLILMLPGSINSVSTVPGTSNHILPLYVPMLMLMLMLIRSTSIASVPITIGWLKFVTVPNNNSRIDPVPYIEWGGCCYFCYFIDSSTLIFLFSMSIDRTQLHLIKFKFHHIMMMILPSFCCRWYYSHFQLRRFQSIQVPLFCCYLPSIGVDTAILGCFKSNNNNDNDIFPSGCDAQKSFTTIFAFWYWYKQFIQ